MLNKIFKGVKALLLILCLFLISISISHSQDYSVELSWVVTADDGYDCTTGDPSIYDLRYSTTGPINDSNWEQATIVENLPIPTECGSTQSYVVTNLQGNTTYWFSLNVGDEVPNWSGPNAGWEIQTPDGIAPGKAEPVEVIIH